MSPGPFPTRQLGRNGPSVSAIGFGAMGMGAFYGKASEDEESFKVLSYATDRGMTFWDTADIYGTSEATIGRWFAQTGRRKEIFLATKFGSRDLRPGAKNPSKANSKPSYIRHQVASSLRDLQTDYIDLYYQHRVDPEVPIEIVLQTLAPFVESGQIKYIGLSECTIDVLRRAKAVPGVGDKLIACQMEYSPFEIELETTGFVATARELGVGIVAYSPLGRGLITGRFRSRADFEPDDFRLHVPRFSDENFPKNLELVEQFRAVGRAHGDASPSLIALAWILAEHPDFVPIPGMRNIERVEENARAAEITLAPEEVEQLRAAVEVAGAVHGERYPPVYLQMITKPCIPLSEWKGEVDE